MELLRMSREDIDNELRTNYGFRVALEFARKRYSQHITQMN
jgi:hypothetical protein